MAWTWRYEDTDGQPVAGPSESFPNQSDAETWLGQSWRELATTGASTVVLYEDERTEYRMDLEPGITE